MRKKLLFLSLFLFSIITAASFATVDSRLILELDIVDEEGLPTDLPIFIGKKLIFKFTCVTKEPTVNVIMYFDGLSTQPVFDESADFFINHEVIIDTIGADLLAGIEHTFSIIANDGVSTDRIDSTMTVDIIDPIFTYISLTHVNTDGEQTQIIDGVVELRTAEHLVLNWSATDQYFKGVRIFRDTLTDELYYSRSASIVLNQAHFAITTPNVFEQTFDLSVIAEDEAGNTAIIDYDVKMIIEDIPYVPQEELENLIIEESAKRKMSQNGLLIGIILVGGFGGVIIGILGATFARTRVRGFVGTGVSSPFKKKDKQDPNELSVWQWIRKYLLSKFGITILIGVSSIILWTFGSWITVKFISPNIMDFSTIGDDIGDGYFWQSFLIGFVWSFPVFSLMTFIVSFITRKGKFDEIYVQMPPKDDGSIHCKVISVFTDRDGKTKVATSSFIDAVNGIYLNINYRDIERLRFKLWVEDEVFTGVYIPAQDIKVTINDVEIDVFKIHGAACIQDLIDSANSQEMAAKFALIEELQKLSKENTDLIRLLTKKIYSAGQDAANEFRIFIEDIESLTSSQVLGDKVKEEFDKIMNEKQVPLSNQPSQEPPVQIPTTNGADQTGT